MSVEPATGVSVMAEALEMMSPQSAVLLLNVQSEDNMDSDVKLAWDPLLAYADSVHQLLHLNCLSAGLFIHYSAYIIMNYANCILITCRYAHSMLQQQNCSTSVSQLPFWQSLCLSIPCLSAYVIIHYANYILIII